MTDLMDRPSPTEPPRIDPRIARRWIDARRQEGRRRLHVLMASLGVLACAGLAAGSLYTPLFQVRHVRIAVAGHISSASVARLAGVTHKTLTIDVNGAAIAARLDADPWLGAARVVRHWPGSVDISVQVRSPIAVVRVPGAGAVASWAEVDPTGRVLADVAGPPTGMPVLQGPGSVPAPGGWVAGSAGAAAAPDAPSSGLADMTASSDGPDVPAGPGAALAFLEALPTGLRADVSSITTASGQGLSLVVNPPRTATGSVTVLLGDGSQLQAKVDALVTMLDQGDLTGVAGVDLSVPSRPSTASSLADLVPAPSTPPGGP